MYTLESVVCLVIDRAFYVCEHCSLNNCIAALLFELNHQHFKNHLNCGWFFFHPFSHFISISSHIVQPFLVVFLCKKNIIFLHISSFRFILNFSNILINKAVKLHENFEALWVTYFLRFHGNSNWNCARNKRVYVFPPRCIPIQNVCMVIMPTLSFLLFHLFLWSFVEFLWYYFYFNAQQLE